MLCFLVKSGDGYFLLSSSLLLLSNSIYIHSKMLQIFFCDPLCSDIVAYLFGFPFSFHYWPHPMQSGYTLSCCHLSNRDIPYVSVENSNITLERSGVVNSFVHLVMNLFLIQLCCGLGKQ